MIKIAQANSGEKQELMQVRKSEPQSGWLVVTSEGLWRDAHRTGLVPVPFPIVGSWQEELIKLLKYIRSIIV